MDHYEVVYIIWTLEPVNDWTPAHEKAFFEKSRTLRPVSVFEAVLFIHELDIEIADFKLSSIDYAQLITFHSEVLTLFFLMNI